MEVFAAQLFILGGNTGRAIVQMADAQVFTTQRHHRAGTETKTVSTQDGTLDHIQPGFQTTIHLQADTVPQTVCNQRMMRLRQTCFPR